MHENRSTVVEAITASGLTARAVARKGCEDLFITATLPEGSSPETMFRAVADLVAARHGSVTSAEVFGLASTGRAGMTALQRAFGQVDWPVTWLDEGCCNRPALAGTVVHAVCGTQVSRARLRGRPVGSTYEDSCARYCVLDDLLPEDTSLSPGLQAKQVLEDMVEALGAVGMTFADVVRTWFWNDRLLDWYEEFNEVRTVFFQEHGVFDGLVPASTGIGGHNAEGSALVAALLAVQGKDEGVKAFAVPSPLQGSAQSYGSSFSRAVELATPEYRQLFVSGTASIAPGGETMHEGDVAAQIGRTMDVVAAILDSRGMSWSDVTRGIAYCKRAKDGPAFRGYCDAHSLPRMPVLAANLTVCRDALLFEIEADAIVPKE